MSLTEPRGLAAGFGGASTAAEAILRDVGAESKKAIAEAQSRWTAFAKERKLRSTSQRDTVCSVFFGRAGHHTVEELLDHVRERDTGIGYATVYRTLKLLVEAGLAHESNFGDGLTRYEFQLEEEHHDHIICLDCRAIIEFENDEIEALQDRIAESLDFRLETHSLELYGRCTLPQDRCPRRRQAMKRQARHRRG